MNNHDLSLPLKKLRALDPQFLLTRHSGTGFAGGLERGLQVRFPPFPVSVQFETDRQRHPYRNRFLASERRVEQPLFNCF